MSFNDKKRPRRDSSGMGIRANIGRSGCEETEPIGLGRIENFERDIAAELGRFGRGLGRGFGRAFRFPTAYDIESGIQKTINDLKKSIDEIKRKLNI